MSTETTTPAERAKQIRDRLAEIAPYPDTDETTTAATLAKYLAVRAAVINHQLLGPDGVISRSQIDLLTVLFAASHALYALDAAAPALGTRVAQEIRNAWEDGGGIGEWLWDHLGSAVWDELGPLADELAALEKPSGGLLAHADTIRQALGSSLMGRHTEAMRERTHAAVAALESELDRNRSTPPADGPCCTGCGDECGCGGSPHGGQS